MPRRLILLPTLFLLFALSAILVSVHAERPDTQLHPEAGATSPVPPLNYAPDRLLVKLRANTGPLSQIDGTWQTDQASLDRLLATNEIQSARPLFAGAAPEAALRAAGLDQIYLLHVAPGRSIAEAAQSLALDPGVEWAEPDYLAYPVDTTPDDPLFAEQWGLTKIQAPAAWDVVTGTSTVAIAIVDSGIDFSHPDLAAKLWVNPGEIAGNGLDDDNNGHIDDINGWDFVNADADPSDDYGHGTQVAGIAAAATDNGTGIAGVCWACTVMPVKVMQASGVANYSDIAAGVLYAAQKGAEVINLSLGGYSYSSALHDAIQFAIGEGAVVVGGAGNDSISTGFYPAAYPEVVAVAGTDEADTKTSASNYGEWIDVSAPAVAITTTFAGGDWGEVNGTSFAAPFVSGLAGLIRSLEPGWSPALVGAQIMHTADPIDAMNPGYEELLGSGRANALAAVTQTPSPILRIAATVVNGDPLGRPVPGESATLEITLGNDWLDASGVAGTLTTSNSFVTITQGTASFGDIPAGSMGTGSPLLIFDVALGAGYNHPMAFVLQVTANGGAFTGSLPLTITTRSAEEPVIGTIGADTTWTSDKTYVVVGNVGVAPGVTLTVEPGTAVEFDGEYSLNVGGTLIADGTEVQPIRFRHHTGGSWGRIFFDDPSADALSDNQGNYLSGNILRWVQVENATGGIDCSNATPYLSRLVSTDGGMTCTLGASSLWLTNSDLAGTVTIIGDGERMGSWQARAAMPTARSRLGVAAAENGKLYAIGGSGDSGDLGTVEEYDPATDTWATRASMPTARSGLGVAAAENGKLYAIGGNGDSSHLGTVEEYDPATDTWATRASMPTPRSGLGVVTASNGRIYALGGYTSPTDIVSTVEEYDPTTDSWVARAAMPTARMGLGVAAENGKLYAIGGSGDSGRLATVEEYDPATDTWAARESMPTARTRLGVAAAANGKIYAIGGWDGSFFATVEEYDPATDSWMARASMPTARDVLGVAAAANSRIYAIGGWGGGNYLLATVEEYTLPTDLFGCHVRDTAVYAGNLTLCDSAEVLASTIGGSLHAASADVQGTAAMGSITIDNGGAVTDSTAGGGVSIGSGTVLNCAVTAGGISIGPGEVLSNTLTGGGISAGDGSLVQGNDVESAPGWAIESSGASTIMTNRLVGSAAGIHAGGGLVQYNLIANTAGTGLRIEGDAAVISNTFTGNAGSAIRVVSATEVQITGNNLEFNAGVYDIENLVPATTMPTVPAQGNWWGMTDPYLISQRIFDYHDDYNMGEVLYSPVTFGPVEDAPAYIRAVSLTPPSPVGLETVTLDVEFSRPMDPAAYPEIGFYTVAVVDNPQWPAPNVYRATYDVSTSIPQGTYTITVRGAVGDDGIEIAPNTAFTIVVDWAGAVGDTTPPPVPTVEACAASTATTLSASWSAFDPDSTITLYRYAIGTAPGGTDVINWTSTPDTSFLRTGLSLIGGQTYYVAVKARNEGGLWSEPGIPAGIVAGSGTCTTNKHTVYLPVVTRQN